MSIFDTRTKAENRMHSAVIYQSYNNLCWLKKMSNYIRVVLDFDGLLQIDPSDNRRRAMSTVSGVRHEAEEKNSLLMNLLLRWFSNLHRTGGGYTEEQSVFAYLFTSMHRGSGLAFSTFRATELRNRLSLN